MVWGCWGGLLDSLDFGVGGGHFDKEVGVIGRPLGLAIVRCGRVMVCNFWPVRFSDFCDV